MTREEFKGIKEFDIIAVLMRKLRDDPRIQEWIRVKAVVDAVVLDGRAVTFVTVNHNHSQLGYREAKRIENTGKKLCSECVVLATCDKSMIVDCLRSKRIKGLTNKETTHSSIMMCWIENAKNRTKGKKC